ncbi:hypothetical protein [Alloactinosynnema sp. L-07]|uniref:hypothetical protein n=1 Tax=Alloactinosynnema sp. L-07 TaxID=1653480 RepID=UPI00065EF68A|nr:hypothetical protein [Alloactinosynnema sp. L-07]CRK58474.1 hypothetical protein [Alloactinosynnema sp. L-07]
MTALRLPDQFSPDALDATAATPTCCCCCCCCLATTLTAPIALHGDLRRDLDRTPSPDRRKAAGPVWAVAVWFTSLIATYTLLDSASVDSWPLIIITCAAGAAVISALVAAAAGSPRPAAAGGRLLLYALLFVVEFFFGGMLLLFFGLYLVVGPLVALAGISHSLRRDR